MESFDQIFEKNLDKGKEINSDFVSQFKQLVLTNNVIKDEDLALEWQLELETIIYNQNKFTEPQFQLFKKNMLRQQVNQQQQKSNFKQTKQQTQNPEVELTKGDANIFKKIQSAKKEIPLNKLIEGVVDADEIFKKQIGKELILEPTRFSYNNNLPQVQVDAQKQKTTITDRFQNSCFKDGTNYLMTNIEKIRNNFEKRINQFKENYYTQFLAKDEYFINDNPNFSKAQEVKMVGRIVSTEKGFLNPTNVRIELSKKQYYDLTFEDDFNFGNQILFPNQIVMVSGLINERENLVVNDLITCHQKEIPQQDLPQVLDIKKENAQLIMVCAGPYTSTMSNQFAVLDNILNIAKSRKVSTLILLGPFLDIKNEILKDGEILIDGKEYTFEQLQNSLFEMALQEIGNQTKIIVIPSTRDILSTDSVPQRPLEINVSCHKDNLIKQSNPAYIELNEELQIYIANSDVGMTTLQNSLLDSKISLNQQSRLVFKSLFNQQNLYSLYPMRNPQDSSQIQEIVKVPNINEFDVDFDHELGNYPKIVISPSSQLPKFAANINNTVVINPSYIIREGTQPGNFCMITYFKNSSLETHQKTRVDFYSL